MSEERLMKTPEEVKQKARELLQMPKEEVLTKYMFQEQEIERLNNIINELDNLISVKIIRVANEEDYQIGINDIVEIKTKLLELKGSE